MHALLTASNFFSQIGGILLAIGILLAMVTVHEFGHYVVGKWLGFKINEFSIGFGPAIFKKRSKKTGELFAVRVVPLGGYCAFDGEDYEEENAERVEENDAPFLECNVEKEQNDTGRCATNEETIVQSAPDSNAENEYPEPQGVRFNEQAPWKRILVLIAGATMNYLLALLVIVCMFSFLGRPLYRVVDRAEIDNGERAEIVEDTDVLQVGDVIVKIEGRDLYLVTDYMDAIANKKQGERVQVTVLRNGEEKNVGLILACDTEFVNMSDTDTLLKAMNVDGLYAQMQKEDFFQTIGHSLRYSVKIGGVVLRSLGELLTGKLGMDAVGGPITTITTTAEAASAGWMSFLSITAFIGVNLAVFNLLPIPALDGSKVVFCLIEWVRGKPINRKVETMIHFVGIVVLFGFAILVDLLRLF